MKLLLTAAALLALSAPAFADATPFLTSRATAPIAPPSRLPSRYAPYSRNTPRLQPTRLAPSPLETSRSGAERVAPYSRNYSLLNRRNG